MSDVWLMNQATFLSLVIRKCRATSCFWSVCSLWSNPSDVSYFYMCYPYRLLSKNTKRVKGRWMLLEKSLSFFGPKFNSVVFIQFIVPFALTNFIFSIDYAWYLDPFNSNQLNSIEFSVLCFCWMMGGWMSYTGKFSLWL